MRPSKAAWDRQKLAVDIAEVARLDAENLVTLAATVVSAQEKAVAVRPRYLTPKGRGRPHVPHDLG